MLDQFHSIRIPAKPRVPLLDILPFSHALRKDCRFLCVSFAINSSGIRIHGCGVCLASPKSVVIKHVLGGPMVIIIHHSTVFNHSPKEAALVTPRAANPVFLLLESSRIPNVWIFPATRHRELCIFSEILFSLLSSNKEPP